MIGPWAALVVVSCAMALTVVGDAAAQQPAVTTAPPPASESQGFFGTLWKAYVDEFRPTLTTPPSEEPEPPRRALPSPLDSPPFPSSEWQGFPLLGLPYSTSEYPLTKALYAIPGLGEFLKNERIKVYGWINASGNWSSADNSNMARATRLLHPPQRVVARRAGHAIGLRHELQQPHAEFHASVQQRARDSPRGRLLPFL